MIYPLLKGLSQKFKLNMDCSPDLRRDFILPAAAANNDPTISVIVIGGSNGDRLSDALATLGMDP